MATIRIKSASRTVPVTLLAEIADGWATVRLAHDASSEILPSVTFRPFCVDTDILYHLPEPIASREAIVAEFDLHVPHELASQTRAHWVAAAIERTCMIQPIDVRGSIQSLLPAIEMLTRVLDTDEALLIVEDSSMVIARRTEGQLGLQLLPVTLEMILDAGHDRGWLNYFTRGIRMYVIGDIDEEAMSYFAAAEPSMFWPLPLQYLLAIANIEREAVPTIDASIGKYALAIGLAAYLGSGTLMPTVVR